MLPHPPNPPLPHSDSPHCPSLTPHSPFSLLLLLLLPSSVLLQQKNPARKSRPPKIPNPKSMAPSHFTPTVLLYSLLLLLLSPPSALSSSLNITSLLSSFPDLSQFSSLLSSSSPSLSSDLNRLSSLTILAVPNPLLPPSPHSPIPPSSLPDVLRYHILLEFLSWPQLLSLPPSGKLVTTLFQTTGRASANSGSVNISRDPLSGLISVRSPAPPTSPGPTASNATVLSLIKTLPYNVSILAVNSLIIPSNFDLMASETRPPPGLNITKVLIDGHNFNVAASMLAASGVVQEFEADEGGAGITMFVPVDDAFASLPPSVSLQSLPADKKAVVLKFHVLHSYYPLGSLESIVNPVQPTLATEAMGAGSFTLNISRVNGSVAINTGIVQASVTQTVFDQNPVAIFGVSKVLLPREVFGKNPIVTTKPGGPIQEGAPPPDSSMSPENSPGLNGQPSHLSSPPGFREEIGSTAGSSCGYMSLFIVLCCIGLYVVV